MKKLEFFREIKAIIGDRSVWMIFLLGPILYSFFYPMPYKPQLTREIPIVVVDQDQTAMSRKLIMMSDETEEVQVLKVTSTQKEAEELLKNGKAFGVLAIPHDFEKEIRMGRSVQVEALGDAGYFLFYSQVATGLYKASATLGAGIEMRRMQAKGVSEALAHKLRDPLPLKTQNLYNSAGGYMSYVVPAVLVLILQQTLLIGMCLRNVKQKNLGGRRIISRSLAYALIYTLHFGFYLWFTYPHLELAELGSSTTLLYWWLSFLILTIGWGWLLSTLFRSRLSAMHTLVLVSMPLIFLTGFSWPLENFSAPVRFLAELMPSTHSVPSFLRVQQMGVSLEAIMPTLQTMLIQAGVVWVLFIIKRGIFSR